MIIFHVSPCGPCGAGTSLHEKFLTDRVPFRVRALHPALRMLGLKTVESTNGAHPKMCPTVLATQTHFFFRFSNSILFYLFAASVCHQNDFDVQILSRRQPYVAISVCGKGNSSEDDIGVMKDEIQNSQQVLVIFSAA